MNCICNWARLIPCLPAVRIFLCLFLLLTWDFLNLQFAYHNRWPPSLATSLPLLLRLMRVAKTQDPKAKTSAHMHVSRAVQLLHLLCYFVSNSLINKFNKTQWQPVQSCRYFRCKFGGGKTHVSAIKRNENKK